MASDPVPSAIELNVRASDQKLVDPALFAGPEGSDRSLGFDDVLTQMELSWVGTSSASLLASLGRGAELEKSLKNAVKKRMAVLRAGLHARKALTKDRSTLSSRGIKRLLESSAALRDRAWLTSNNTDFELAESALTDALAAAGRPLLRLRCLVALSRCYELHGIALGDMTNWELSAIMAHRAIELAMTYKSSDGTSLHELPRVALEDAIEAALTWVAKDISVAEILPAMRHKLMDQAANPLGLARSLLNYDPGARLTFRQAALSFTRYGALERRYLMLESRAALQRYLMSHEVESLRSAIGYAGSARGLSDRSHGDDWGDSSLLLARYLCWLAGTELDEQELSAVVSSGLHALGDALLSATFAGPSNLESLELCGFIFTSGDESSRSVARLVREQGCLGSALKFQPHVRYRMTRDWAEEEVERGNWPLAVQLYDAALAALDDLTASDWEGHRELWLASGAQLQASAAHAHAMIGEPLRALEIADAARLSILTSSSADWLAPELTRLAEQGHGDLADAMNKADIALRKRRSRGSYSEFLHPTSPLMGWRQIFTAFGVRGNIARMSSEPFARWKDSRNSRVQWGARPSGSALRMVR